MRPVLQFDIFASFALLTFHYTNVIVVVNVVCKLFFVCCIIIIMALTWWLLRISVCSYDTYHSAFSMPVLWRCVFLLRTVVSVTAWQAVVAATYSIGTTMALLLHFQHCHNIFLLLIVMGDRCWCVLTVTYVYWCICVCVCVYVRSKLPSALFHRYTA